MLSLMLKVTLSMFTGLDIRLSDVTVSLTRYTSCCGDCSGSSFTDDSGTRQRPMQCECDSFCVIYGDCCLDYALLCLDVASGTSAGSVPVPVEMSNCSDGRPGDMDASGSLMSEGVTAEDQCEVWKQEATNGSAQEYLCQLRAMWVPVILERRSTKRFAAAPGRERYMLIQDCKLNATQGEIDSCLLKRPLQRVKHLYDVISLLPVTAGDGLHYMNAHCALCNGFDSQDVVYWTILFQCRPPDLNLTAIFSTNVSLVATNCEITVVKKPTVFPWWKVAPLRLAPSIKISQCGDSLYGAACRAYSLPFDGYPNKHCAICVNSNTNGTSIYGPDSNTSNAEPCPLCGSQIKPISALFDFSPSNGASLSLRGQAAEIIPPSCKHGQVVDMSTGDCRVFYCPYGQVVAADGVSCASLGNQTDYHLKRFDVQNETGLFSCEMLFRSELPIDDPTALVLIQQILRGVILVKTPNLKEASSSQPNPLNDCSSRMSYSYTVSIVGHDTNTTDIKALSRSVADALRENQCWNLTNPKVSLSILNVWIRNFEQSFLQNECAKQGQELTQFTQETFKRFTTNGVSYVQILINNETLSFPSLETLREITHTTGVDSYIDESVLLCREKLLCPIVVLNSSEFTYINTTELAVFRGTERNFSSGDFIEMSDGKIAVCVFRSNVMNGTESNPEDITEKILSLVGITISLVFLLLSLINYYMFPELRKLPGKNMISFILALFSLLLMFLLGINLPTSHVILANDTSCLLFAVFIHYFLLAVFFLSNVTSLHFVRTFGCGIRLMKPTGSTRRDNKVFLLYSLYGWGVPGIIAGAGCAVHFLVEIDGQLENVYRGCMIYGWGIVYFVALPSSCLMSLNVVFFIVTLVGIRKTRRDTRVAQREMGRRETLQMELSICFKVGL